jgi:hypothetical protein
MAAKLVRLGARRLPGAAKGCERIARMKRKSAIYASINEA